MNMVNTFDQLVNIAQIVRKCPTTTLSRAFTRAYRDFCNESQYLKVNIAGATVADQQVYTLGNDPFLDIVGVAGMQGSQDPGQGIQYWPIVPSDPTLWDPNLSVNTSTTMPVRYAYLPQAQFALDPTPKQVYSLLVSVIVQPKEGAAQVPEAGLTKYSNEIEAGAMAYLLMIPGQPWTNPGESERQRRVFQSGVSNAKADVQRAFNNGSVRVRPRAFMR